MKVGESTGRLECGPGRKNLEGCRDVTGPESGAVWVFIDGFLCLTSAYNAYLDCPRPISKLGCISLQ